MKTILLDALAEDNVALDDLDSADLAAVLAKIGAAQTRVAARLAELASKHGSHDAVSHLLDVKEAAGRLGVSPTWLYRRADRLPFTRRVGGHLRFDHAGLERWIATRPSGRALDQ